MQINTTTTPEAPPQLPPQPASFPLGSIVATSDALEAMHEVDRSATTIMLLEEY